MIRRTIVILALTAASGLLASCGKSDYRPGTTTTQTAGATGTHNPSGAGGHTRTVRPLTKAQALAFAREVNLTAADVPGFEATSRDDHESKTPVEKGLERELTHCTGESLSSPGGLVDESSSHFKLEHGILHFGVNSEVSVAQTPALAASELKAIRSSRVRACLSRYLGGLLKYQILKEQTSPAIINPKSISLSMSQGTPPAPGATGSFGWRITATVAVHNIKLPFYIDILGFVYGPAEVTLTSSGAIRPFPASTQEHLYLLLLKRAETSPA